MERGAAFIASAIFWALVSFACAIARSADPSETNASTRSVHARCIHPPWSESSADDEGPGTPRRRRPGVLKVVSRTLSRIQHATTPATVECVRDPRESYCPTNSGGRTRTDDPRIMITFLTRAASLRLESTQHRLGASAFKRCRVSRPVPSRSEGASHCSSHGALGAPCLGTVVLEALEQARPAVVWLRISPRVPKRLLHGQHDRAEEVRAAEVLNVAREPLLELAFSQ